MKIILLALGSEFYSDDGVRSHSMERLRGHLNEGAEAFQDLVIEE